MLVYTVKQLSDLANISVRTLHYYDEIGLLSPESRSISGYRLYDKNDLLKLQQIMFYRELGVKLGDIKQIISNLDFNLVEALQSHRALLAKNAERTQRLIETIDKTISQIRGEIKMDIKEYYEGFSDEQIDKYRHEVKERWGEATLKNSEERVLKMGTSKFQELQSEGNRIFQAIADKISLGPDSPEVQNLVAQWRQWLENYHHYSYEALLGLGQMYSQHPDFVKFYGKFHPDMPEFFTKAIELYCAKVERE